MSRTIKTQQLIYNGIDDDIIHPETEVGQVVGLISELANKQDKIYTVAPTAPNTDGIKVVVLSEAPAVKYDGWLYLITE